MDWGISSVLKQNINQKIPLQRYWTRRYAVTLIIGLIIVTFISAWWIRHSALEDRLQLMEIMAEEIAQETVSGEPRNEQDLADANVHEFLTDPGKYMNIESNPSIFITNVDGEILYQNQESPKPEFQFNPTILMEEKAVTKLRLEEEIDDVYLVKKPITVNQSLLGWVVLLEKKAPLQAVNQEYKQLFIMIGALALFGWLAIYFLSKRLAKPITDVAKAAEQIKEGNYDIKLQDDVRELEVYELIQAFKGMSERLDQLETLRTELLAGVTHELKTPVTSISGLIQAVNEGVVTGEEAEEFLNISLQETAKMEKMVEDLLAFNSFATNTLPLSLEEYNLNKVIKNIADQWKTVPENTHVKMNIEVLNQPVVVNIDRIRIEQILVNLWNNAKDAQETDATIHILLTKDKQMVYIDVIDEGGGITEAEQPFIFERFYRGKMKQTKTSGFGLGLAFSKMIAEAHDGELQLVESSSSGTTFRLMLPYVNKEDK